MFRERIDGKKNDKTASSDKGEIILYRSPDGKAALDVRLEQETVWLNQRQMAELFDKDTDTIGLHVRNIYKEGELTRKGTTEQSSVVQNEGGRQVRRKVNFYNLDVIISVGYRVKSRRGTQFRIWATNVLREHLIRGFTLNEKRLREQEQKLVDLRRTVGLLEQTLAHQTIGLDEASCLEDIELLRNDEAWLNALGAELISDPTTAGDFLRRFDEDQIIELMEAKNEIRKKIWRRQPRCFRKEAVINVDGTISETSGECKEGMDISCHRGNLVKLAKSLTEWDLLERKPGHTVKTRKRRKAENIKKAVVKKRKFKTIQTVSEYLSEFSYKPGKCKKPYRMIVLKKILKVTKVELKLFDNVRYFFYITNDAKNSKEQILEFYRKRADHENDIEQLKNGACALKAPSNTLLSNWAYMAIASTAWDLKAWYGLLIPYRHLGKRIVRMEFKRFIHTFIRIPCLIIRTGRKIVYRLVGYNHSLKHALNCFHALKQFNFP
ncbi:conserved uncharacterized protein [Desulfococcus multivorans]|nr:conserved uncharacterized protein [Desulfococcus multivorans]